MKTIHEVSTRANERAGTEPTITNLTIDWEGMTEDDLVALAAQTLVIKLQGRWRKNGAPQGEHTVLATDYKVGVRAPRGKPDVFALIGQMSPEEKAALLAKLSA